MLCRNPEATSGPRGRAGLFPLTFLPPFSPTLRQPQFGPLAAAPPCPPRRRGRYARVALRTRRDRRLPPLPTQPETILQTPPTDCLHPETADSGPDRIPPPATVARRIQAGNPHGAASEPFSVPWLSGTPAAAARRAVPSPVPCGRSATCVFSACRRFDVPQPAIAAGSVSRSG